MTPEEAKQEYDAQGYIVIRNALAPEELGRVREAFDRAAEVGALRDLLNQDDIFVDMVDHPVLFSVVRRLWETMCRCATPKDASPSPIPIRDRVGTVTWGGFWAFICPTPWL